MTDKLRVRWRRLPNGEWEVRRGDRSWNAGHGITSDDQFEWMEDFVCCLLREDSPFI